MQRAPSESEVVPVSANLPSTPSAPQLAHRGAISAAGLLSGAVAFAMLGILSMQATSAHQLRVLHYLAIPALVVVLKICFDYARTSTPSRGRVLPLLGGGWVLFGASAHWLAHFLRDEHPAGVAMIAGTSLTRAGHGEAFVNMFAALVLVAKVSSSGLLWAGFVRHAPSVARAVALRPGAVPWAWLSGVLGVREFDSTLRRARAWYLIPVLIPMHVVMLGALDLGAAGEHLGVLERSSLSTARWLASATVLTLLAGTIGGGWLAAARARTFENVSLPKR